VVRTELILQNEVQTSPTGDDKVLVNCPTIEEISIPVTYQIADVRDPGYVNGSRSKTISIPGTPDVDKFFEDVYDVNVSLQYVNPNLKIRAYVITDGIPTFDGHLQILRINVDEVTKSHVYECNIIGEQTTLMTKIKNLLLTDLNFSTYSHALTYANISSSWTAPLFSGALGSGVVYGLKDWGTNNSNLQQVRPEDFKPSLFIREILYKIFAAQGYTWTSTFLDSTEFKRKTLPAANFLNISDTVKDNHKFLATADGTQVIVTNSTSLPGNYVYFGTLPNPNPNTVNFTNETYDTGNIFTGNQFTVPDTAYYNIAGNLTLNFQVTRDVGAGPVDVTSNITANQITGIWIGLYNTSTLQYVENDLSIYGGVTAGTLATTTFQKTISLSNVQLTAGHVYFVTIRFANVKLFYTSATAGATWKLNTTVGSASNFSAQLSSDLPFEGQTVNVNDMLPSNYKQSDFLSDIIRTFHLHFKPDKSDPNNIIIEPWPTFYSATPQNWEHKHAKNTNVEVIPMGELDFNKLICRYAEDGDFYNKLYFDEFKEPYGTYEKIIQNDFIKNERVITTGFAPTPYAINPVTGVILPQILKKDNNVIGQIKPKMRILHWSGLINMPAGASWTFSYNNGANTVVYTQQPHEGHADNPYNPTLDLSWGVPHRVYFDIPNQQWTTNNLYNKYYSQYFNQITDKNSKIIKTGFFLTPNDIHNFDFQRPVFTVINGQQGYYIVNKIEEYNPLLSEVTQVELLKLIDYDAFAGEYTDVDVGDGSGGNSTNMMVMGNNIVQGPNNTSYGNDSMIVGGNNNFISNSAESVAILNSTELTVVGESNFLGVNLSVDSEVGSNMINLQDNVKIYSDGMGAIKPRVLRVTADFTVDGTYDIYEIDLDSIGVAITANWDVAAYEHKVTFKIVANTYNIAFYIDENNSPPVSPPPQIDGNALPYDTGMITYESITVYSNGTNLYII